MRPQPSTSTVNPLPYRLVSRVDLNPKLALIVSSRCGLADNILRGTVDQTVPVGHDVFAQALEVAVAT